MDGLDEAERTSKIQFGTIISMIHPCFQSFLVLTFYVPCRTTPPHCSFRTYSYSRHTMEIPPEGTIRTQHVGERRTPQESSSPVEYLVFEDGGRFLGGVGVGIQDGETKNKF